MSIEGIRVVLVHEAGHKPVRWVELLGELCAGVPPQLLADDTVDAETLLKMEPHRIIFNCPVASEIYQHLLEQIPMMATQEALPSYMESFGGQCIAAKSHDENYLMHDAVGVWTGYTEPLEVSGYPTLVPDQNDLPAELVVTAWNDERVALAMTHRLLPVVGINFHPDDLEGYLGKGIVLAFLEGTYLTGAPMGPPEI